MIPKKIHYCWFGGAEKSALIRQCIDTWRKVMPDYEIVEWNEKNFDLQNAVPFVKEALAAGKWAFVADYVRLYAMYTEGGIYMDTDVKVIKRYDEFLDNSFFSCQESHPDIFVPESIDSEGVRNEAYKQVLGIGICSAVMGAEKGCQYLKDCLDHYATLHYSKEQESELIIVNILAVLLEKYGYHYILDKVQNLSDRITILEPWVFSGMTTRNANTYALHLYNGSWVEGNDTLKHRLRNMFPSLYGALQSISYKLRR